MWITRTSLSRILRAPDDETGGGADTQAAADTVAAAAAVDTITGGAGNDAITEPAERGLLDGEQGDTKAGNDTVAGSDTVAGVAGLDLLGAPEGDYVLTLGETPPEGLVLDEAAVALAAPVLKELNISQAGADKLMSKLYVPLVQHIQKQGAEAAEKARVETIAKWATEAPADPRFGGADGYAEALTYSRAAYNRFASDELKTLLNVSGLGNRPEFIQLFAEVGKATGEGGFVREGEAPKPKPKNDGELLYPGFNNPQADA